MTRFAANLSMLFTEHPFLDRFEAAAAAGFEAVEYLFPYEYPAEEIRLRLERFGLEQALFNLPPGDWAAGERGLAALPGREEEFRAGVDLALDYAEALDCPALHVMAGIAEPEDAEARERYVSRVRYAADRSAERYAERSGDRSAGHEHAGPARRILIEPINPIGMPGYFLRGVAQARELLARIDRENVAIQLDLFHAQITDGDLSRLIAALGPDIGHVQVASVPARAEPDGGELNLPYLLDRLAEAGYRGWVGCEYVPAGGTLEGLGWLRRYPGFPREDRPSAAGASASGTSADGTPAAGTPALAEGPRP